MSQALHSRSAWLKSFAIGRPIFFSLLVIILAGLLTEPPLSRIFASLVGQRTAGLLAAAVGHTVTGLLLVGLLLVLNMLPQARLTPPSQWKALWLGWPLLAITLLNLEPLLDGSVTIETSQPELILAYCLLMLSIGFCEEVLGRALVLGLMLRKWGNSRRGIYRAVLLSSVLFGLAHLFNLATGRLPLLPNLTQVAYCFVFGVLFAALVLRNRSIWPMIIMHTAIDFGGGLRHIAVEGTEMVVANSSTTEVLSTLIVSLPLLLYGLHILRKVSPEDCVL